MIEKPPKVYRYCKHPSFIGPQTKNIIYIHYEPCSMATEQTQKLITVTAKAAEKISEFIGQEAEKPEFLRVYVQGGGCSGLSYGMGFEKAPEEDDLVLEENGVKILVDSYSQDHLRGANVDYIESLMGSGFKINNPNAVKSCSCSHSE